MAKIITPTEEALTAKVWQMADVLAAHGIGNTDYEKALYCHTTLKIKYYGNKI